MREEGTMRVRQIKPNENSIWDDISGPNAKFFRADLSKGLEMMAQSDGDAKTSPHLFYSAANAAEDAVLFPDEANAKNWLFKKIDPLPAQRTPPTWLRFLGSQLRGKINGRSTDAFDIEAMDTDEYSSGDMDSPYDSDDRNSIEESGSEPSAEHSNLWKLPTIWEDAIGMIQTETLRSDRKQLLQTVGIASENTGLMIGAPRRKKDIHEKLFQSDRQEIMERDRCYCSLALNLGDP
jgi:hypothetical protein